MELLADSLGGGHGSNRVVYRNCPKCRSSMQRINFDRRSGVVIDSCKDHGVWFDAGELKRVAQYLNELPEPAAKAQPERTRKKAAPIAPRADVGTDPLLDLFAEIIDWLPP